VGRLAGLSTQRWDSVNEYFCELANQLWVLMTDLSREDVALGHDGYFKLWSLSGPKLSHDFILVDEAQDSNAALLSVLAIQSSQVVYVGDRFQQIYEWRGAVNAMQSVTTQETAILSQSFRFGPEIAAAATQTLQTLDPSVEISGSVNRSTLRCSNPDAFLARRNIDLIREAIIAQEMGKQFHIIGGTYEQLQLLKDVVRLKEGKKARHAEFFGFSNWNEVVASVEESDLSSLRTFVRIVEEFGENQLIDLLGVSQFRFRGKMH